MRHDPQTLAISLSLSQITKIKIEKYKVTPNLCVYVCDQ
jgi:DNA-binding XRE family transcriptional regulator